jgi:hypothetical protein
VVVVAGVEVELLEPESDFELPLSDFEPSEED